MKIMENNVEQLGGSPEVFLANRLRHLESVERPAELEAAVNRHIHELNQEIENGEWSEESVKETQENVSHRVEALSDIEVIDALVRLYEMGMDRFQEEVGSNFLYYKELHERSRELFHKSQNHGK